MKFNIGDIIIADMEYNNNRQFHRYQIVNIVENLYHLQRYGFDKQIYQHCNYVDIDPYYTLDKEYIWNKEINEIIYEK